MTPSADELDVSAGAARLPVVYMSRHVRDGIAFDVEGRLWIGCHRPVA